MTFGGSNHSESECEGRGELKGDGRSQRAESEDVLGKKGIGRRKGTGTYILWICKVRWRIEEQGGGVDGGISQNLYSIHSGNCMAMKRRRRGVNVVMG